MALPWLVAIGAEYAVFRRFFATDLDAGAQALACCRATRGAGVRPGDGGLYPRRVCPHLRYRRATELVAAAGAAVLAARTLGPAPHHTRRHRRSPNVPFLFFVLALGIVVRAVVDNGLGGALGHLLPGGTTLPALLGTAALAAVLANMINNLPAVLAPLPLAVPAGSGAVLAVLLGVNIGPNLTYTGSLATLLWRRIMREHDTDVDLEEFTRLGLLTVPAALILAVLALWASLHAIGG